jgi:hypothetical protein
MDYQNYDSKANKTEGTKTTRATDKRRQGFDGNVPLG